MLTYQVTLLFSFRGRIEADQIPSASRDPGDLDVDCLVAVLDVDGRHGPLCLAHSVFNQSPTQWPSEFVDPFASLHELSWANFVYC